MEYLLAIAWLVFWIVVVGPWLDTDDGEPYGDRHSAGPK